MTATPMSQPAPWAAEYLPYTSQDGHEIPNFRINDADDNAVCETNENLDADVQEANAYLIAAAPQLLAAASLVIERWSSGDLADAVRQLQAAIVAARGGIL